MRETIAFSDGVTGTFDPAEIAGALGRTLGKKRGAAETGSVSGGVSGEQLRSIVGRVERLEEERKSLGEDIRDVYAEPKGHGYDTKILRKLIALRKRDRAELDEEHTVLDVYMRALGMLPLFEGRDG